MFAAYTDVGSTVLERILIKANQEYMNCIGADKSLDYDRLQAFLNEATTDFQAIKELWKLQNLCVHVDHQRRGIGSMFLKWGQKQAEREEIPIGLESAEAARPTYLKNGFRVYGYMHVKAFPIEEVSIFIWEPKGMEGLWGTKEEPKNGWESLTARHPSGNDSKW
jgi:GNAT superfamily N-acetyltransferase